MSQAAPLPGVLILTTTSPLYTPTLLLSSHIRHPLKAVYPRLVAEQWAAYLAERGLEANPSQVDPVIWLRGLPAFTALAQAQAAGGSETDEDDGESRRFSDEASDEEDENGNVWRASRLDSGPSDLVMKQRVQDANSASAIANLTVGQVTYLAPIPQGNDPLLSLAFLSQLHTVLTMYFQSSTSMSTSMASSDSLSPIPAAVLSSQFDLVYQVLQEMLDEGRPLTTEYNSIKNIVRGKAWWEDLMGKMSSYTSSAAVSAPPPQVSPLPWRSASTRYSRNEIFVDIVEMLSGTMDRRGKSVGQEGLSLSARIGCKARLSGTPDLKLSLHPQPNGPYSVVVAPSFHPCVRYKHWIRDGVISFVPPDGEFELAQMDIRRDLGVAPLTSNKSPPSHALSEGWDRYLPFRLTARRELVDSDHGNEWTFEIRLKSSGLSTKSHSASAPNAAENIEVSFSIQTLQPTINRPGGQDTISIDARAAVSSTSGYHSSVSGFGSSSLSSGSSVPGSMSTGDDAGSWHFDARSGVVKWSVPRLGPSPSVAAPSEVTLKGRVTTSGGIVPGLAQSGSLTSREDDKASRPQTVSTPAHPSALLSTFSLPVGTPSLSGLRVASLVVSGQGIDYKPFKGVRGATRAKVEWRW